MTTTNPSFYEFSYQNENVASFLGIVIKTPSQIFEICEKCKNIHSPILSHLLIRSCTLFHIQHPNEL